MGGAVGRQEDRWRDRRSNKETGEGDRWRGTGGRTGGVTERQGEGDRWRGQQCQKPNHIQRTLASRYVYCGLH